MASTVNNAKAITLPSTPESVGFSEGLRIARYCTLDELPGLVFGVMTLMYVVVSLAGLTL